MYNVTYIVDGFEMELNEIHDYLHMHGAIYIGVFGARSHAIAISIKHAFEKRYSMRTCIISTPEKSLYLTTVRYADDLKERMADDEN